MKLMVQGLVIVLLVVVVDGKVEVFDRCMEIVVVLVGQRC